MDDDKVLVGTNNIGFSRTYNVGDYNSVKLNLDWEVQTDKLDTEIMSKLLYLFGVLSDLALIKYTTLHKKVKNYTDLLDAEDFLETEKQSVKDEIRNLLKGE